MDLCNGVWVCEVSGVEGLVAVRESGGGSPPALLPVGRSLVVRAWAGPCDMSFVRLCGP